MADRLRIAVSPPALHVAVLRLWADLEDRSLSDISLMLMENALRSAARQGDMPQQCIELLRSPPLREAQA